MGSTVVGRGKSFELHDVRVNLLIELVDILATVILDGQIVAVVNL